MSIAKLQKIIDDSDNIVFFGGAGVSTESGIPDFRSADGIYSKKYKYPAEVILSHTFFLQHMHEFFEFYKEKMLYLKAQPNKAHKKLAELEKAGKLKAVITQNIDGLHKKAGSKNVLELHGSVYENYCMKCGEKYDVSMICQSKDIPYCECGGVIRPKVVMYEEALDDSVMRQAEKYIQNADVLIVGGTSLAVYPAAGLINIFAGEKLVLINKSRTPYDSRADIVIEDSIGQALGRIEIKR